MLAGGDGMEWRGLDLGGLVLGFGGNWSGGYIHSFIHSFIHSLPSTVRSSPEFSKVL
jgi:hypothetical protein